MAKSRPAERWFWRPGFGRRITIYTYGNEALVTEMQDALGGDSKRIVYEPRGIARIKMVGPEKEGIVIVLEDAKDLCILAFVPFASVCRSSRPHRQDNSFAVVSALLSLVALPFSLFFNQQ